MSWVSPHKLSRERYQPARLFRVDLLAAAFDRGDKRVRIRVAAYDNILCPHAIAGEDASSSLDRAGWVGWRWSLPIVRIAAVIGIGRTHFIDHRPEHRNTRGVELPSSSLDLGRPTDLAACRQQRAIGPAPQDECIGNRQNRRGINEDQGVALPQLGYEHREIAPLEKACGVLHGSTGTDQVESPPLHRR